MILLDTNVLSALMESQPDAKIIRWLDKQPRTSIWTTSITVFEIRFGLKLLAAGRKQTLLTEAFDSLLATIFQQRIADFDHDAAEYAGDLMAERHKRGYPPDVRDTMIAGIALGSRATIATRNIRHFEDLSTPVINPWML